MIGRSGELAGQKPGNAPNLRQLAKLLDLSVTTVSRALKDGPEVREDTRARVKKAAAELGYYPNSYGAALRTGRTRVLTAILPLQTASYLNDLAKVPLIEGMTLAAQERDYTLSIYSTTAAEDQLVSLLRLIQSGSCDGVIVTRMARHDPRVRLLLERDIPFVAFGRSEDSLIYPYVDVDNQRIADEATRFLLDRGHRRIGLQVLKPDDATGRMRMLGYAAALQAHGLAVDDALLAADVYGILESEAAIDRMFDLDAPPTAIICWNELGALGAMTAIRKRGLAIGGDVELITRDSTHLSGNLVPALTHHFVDMAEAGRLLVDLLIRRIDGAAPAGLQAIVQGRLVLAGEAP